MAIHRRKGELRGFPGQFGWYLMGSAGAVQFLASHIPTETRWVVGREMSGVELGLAADWTGFDIGYHSFTPLFAGQRSSVCTVFETSCFYGGDPEPSQPLCRAWLADDQNDEVIWGELERFYGLVFGGTNDPGRRLEEVMATFHRAAE